MTELLFDDETIATLHSWGFDSKIFRNHQENLRSGEDLSLRNRIGGEVEVPPEGAIVPLPDPTTAAHGELVRRGQEAIARGAVGMVVLSGGMATRFGGVVKALVPAVDDHTFLDLKLADALSAAESVDTKIHVSFMTSFATDRAVRDAVEQATRRGDLSRLVIETFPQLISVRLTPEGDVFSEDDGSASLYAPGHGDLTFALRSSGALARFREAGGELLFMSNVDNLLATLDPAVIGAHLESGAAISVECVDKLPGDKGGAPALVDGRVEIVESFRFPDDFDQDAIGVFNTNTFVLDAEAIDRDFELTWFAVEKEVSGRRAIQFEHLVGQLTAFLPSHYLRVERSGPNGRFAPVKDPAELEQRRPEIRAALSARGVLRSP
jgi:UTP--glucose-1-phosphate uridylyltransferase